MVRVVGAELARGPCLGARSRPARCRSRDGLTFADRCLAQLATSLGGTHTKASHAASTTHRQLDSRALVSAGIDPGAVRFSIGLEDAEDLISDAYVALDSLGRP